jgi:iron complex outermembrane receptor protein
MAAPSRAFELGVKAIVASRHRVNVAVFTTDTKNEIVVDTATGGRTIYKNAGRTERRGVEAVWDGQLTPTVTVHAAYTWLRATFADAFTTGTPPALVASGARLPGVPSTSAYAELAYAPGGLGGFNTALEVQYMAKIYVNERNSDAAPASTVANFRIGFEQKALGVRWREFLRVNNIADRRYVGSVIVADTNGRFFEPAPGRNWFLGVSANVAF